MTVPACSPLDGQDPILLDLLRLAAEVIAHPEAVPPGLYELCDSWAGELAAVVNMTPGTEPGDPGLRRLPATGPALVFAGPGIAGGQGGPAPSGEP